VFHPENVYPVRAKEPELVASVVTAFEVRAKVGAGTEPDVAEFVSYVIVESHSAKSDKLAAIFD
jgi:hypothetical protein